VNGRSRQREFQLTRISGFGFGFGEPLRFSLSFGDPLNLGMGILGDELFPVKEAMVIPLFWRASLEFLASVDKRGHSTPIFLAPLSRQFPTADG
jgi:hypothetical protein